MKMKLSSITAILPASILCLILSGCDSSAPKQAFTLEEHERLNTLDAIFQQYSSVRQEYYFSDIELSGDGWGELIITQTLTLENGDINAYVSFLSRDGGDESFSMTSYVNGNIFHLYDDGSYGVGIYSDQTSYREQYLPLNLRYALNMDFDVLGIRVASVDARDGIRTITIHSEDDGYTEYMWGITGATMETVHITDEATGLIQCMEAYLLLDGKRILWAGANIIYGEDDGYKPEYVEYLIVMGEVSVPAQTSAAAQ